MNEMKIESDNNIEIIVDREQLKGNSKPKGFWAKLKDIWNKTIFARKIEENAWKRELMKEVKEESKEDLKKIMKEQYLQREKDKLSGNAKKSGFMGKLANALAEEGKSMGSGKGGVVSTDKINMMLGKTSNNTNSNNKVMGMGSFGNNIQDKVMGKSMTDKERAKKKKEEEERIKRLLR